MYSSLTDRARKVFQLANLEAKRLGQEYVGTEHILLGLVKEGSGIAAQILQNLNISLVKIDEEIGKLVQPGPGFMTAGRLTPLAKKVVDNSIEEAQLMGHKFTGTEHILLALCRENEGVASQVLMALGLSADKVREEIKLIVAPSQDAAKNEQAYTQVVNQILLLCNRYQSHHNPQMALEQIVQAIKVFQDNGPL